ncbi:MAG: riboflavin kinase / FAD synthase RibC [uncultured bacterium]|nr:MAG: riboflavin kinase / FAD synthase RibC [uncultured bacterium]
MKVFNSSNAAKTFCKKGVALTIGNYDGVHLGHQDILKQLTKISHKLKLPSVVYTFNPHPVKVLSQKVAPQLLQSIDQKKELIQNKKIDALIIEKFDKKFSHTTAQDFFKKILIGKLNVKFIIVGYDFTFGAKRGGNQETLEQLCLANHIGFIIHPAYFLKETLVSSSLIRKQLAAGEISMVNKLLGRNYFLDGLVVSGDKRGQALGFPTANIETDQELVPQVGVYKTVTQVGQKKYPSITNIGYSPTFGKNPLRVETHLIGKKMDLYGKKIRVFFIARIRNEKKFASKKALIAQIKSDIKHALKNK